MRFQDFQKISHLDRDNFLMTNLWYQAQTTYSRLNYKFPDLTTPKFPGLIDRKRPNINNMGSLTID